MTEQQLQSKIKCFLKKDGWIVIKTIVLSENGFPDLFCFRNPGKTMFIEAKALGRKPEPLQEYRINELIKQGFKAFYCDSFEMFKEKYGL
jgi:hypothetical protein